MIDHKTILITGGTGSFGNKFVQVALEKHKPRRIIIFSRDELKQSEMRSRFASPRLDFFCGDLRDYSRLKRALEADVDIVIHAGALKQIASCERNPSEAVMTNVMGSKNVMEAAIDVGISKVIGLSTDKSVASGSLYGATKHCAEKLFIQGNSYASGKSTKLSCVRYGNVIASRGSVIPIFKEQAKNGRVTITDPRMTRFWMTLSDAVELVIKAIGLMSGGEVFVPQIGSASLLEVAQACSDKEVEIEIIGLRPGEKLHEILLSADEARHSVKYKDLYVINPEFKWWAARSIQGEPLEDGFEFRSDTNSRWLGKEELKKMIEEE